LSSRSIAEIPIPLAPYPEQKRIVAKIEELLKQVNASRDRLTNVTAILKRFRQAVLAAACSGRLTEDWREKNPVGDSAKALLSKILADRKAKTRNTKEPCEPDTSLLGDVPEEWIVVSTDALTSHITSGSRDWKRYYRDDGAGTFVMAQNVRPLRFDTSYRQGVQPPPDDRDRERSEIKKGDLLITIVGANTGDLCRVTESVEQHYVCQSVALMRPVFEETSQFLEIYLSSAEHGLAQYQNWIYGEGRPHLSFEQLKATAVALPPLGEQHEIVRRVQALFKLADKIEKRVEAATKRADKLTQAILAKAFRGELVPTEAELARLEGRDYEPASVLLERIRAERENATQVKPIKTRSRRGQ
jgi:type I restriction enzyme S subunit